jgi:hypothetical protein
VNTQTQPCPAMSDGSAFQCHRCPLDIQIGAASVRDARGNLHHPDCLNLTPLEAVRRAAVASRGGAPVRAALRQPDIGDRLCALDAANRSGYVAGKSFDEVVSEELEKLLSEDESTSTHPEPTSRAPSGLGGRTSDGRDMGDLIIDLMDGVQS